MFINFDDLFNIFCFTDDSLIDLFSELVPAVGVGLALAFAAYLIGLALYSVFNWVRHATS